MDGAAHHPASVESIRIRCRVVYDGALDVEHYQESPAGLLLRSADYAIRWRIRENLALGFRVARADSRPRYIPSCHTFHATADGSSTGRLVCPRVSGLGFSCDVRHTHARVLDLGRDLLGGRLGFEGVASTPRVVAADGMLRFDEVLRDELDSASAALFDRPHEGGKQGASVLS